MGMDIQTALGRIAERQDLSNTEMVDVMRQIMSAGTTDVQIGAFLLGMRIKGETIDEITGGVQVLREFASGVKVSGPNLVDIVGTGGDGANLFNVSTAACFVVAAAGGRVAKHGNRSVSSSSGSADVLEAAGVNLNLSPDQVALCVQELGVGFMFAPAHHSAMRHAIGPRKELGMRTVFNILGPLTNPAGVKQQVIGVYSPDLCQPMAEVLKLLGAEHAMIVHSDDGLDEISIAAGTQVSELHAGSIETYHITPEEFSLERQSLDGLTVTDSASSAALITSALAGAKDETSQKAAAILVLNAGAAIYVAGVAATLADGVAMAEDAIGNGLAAEKLRQFIEFTRLMRQER